jgi:hypothetical protein
MKKEGLSIDIGRPSFCSVGMLLQDSWSGMYPSSWA